MRNLIFSAILKFNFSKFVFLNLYTTQFIEQISGFISLHLKMADFYLNIGITILRDHLSRLSLKKIDAKTIKDTLNGECLSRTSLAICEQR